MGTTDLEHMALRFIVLNDISAPVIDRAACTPLQKSIVHNENAVVRARSFSQVVSVIVVVGRQDPTGRKRSRVSPGPRARTVIETTHPCVVGRSAHGLRIGTARVPKLS